MPRSRLLTSDDWPESELRAAVLAGDLVAVGPCWSSPAEPQTPSLRAAAAASALADARLTVCTRTAAWVWGATSRPPTPLEACVSTQARVRPDPGLRLREIVVGDEDVVVLAGVRVTAPLRTVVDLLRSPSDRAGRFGGEEAAAAAGLLAIGAVTPEAALERLGSLGTIPMVRQAERRLLALQEPAGAVVR